MARTLDREPTFQTVKVTPGHSPPAGVVTNPFFHPTDQPTTESFMSTSGLPGTDSSAAKHQSFRKPQSNRPHSDQPTSSELSSTNPLVFHRQATKKDSISSLELEAGSESSDRPPIELYVEEGELSDDQDVTVMDQDQSLSEEPTYREAKRGIRSYMGWSHIPDMDTSPTCWTTTLLLAQRLKFLVRCRSRCQVVIGYVESSAN